MKRSIVLLLFIAMSFGLSSCYTATFNRLGREDALIFESEDQSIRLEIGMKTSTIGRLYVFKDDQMQTFLADYFIPREQLAIYINIPELEDSIFALSVSFESINFFKANRDVMHLEDDKDRFSNPEHDIFSGFDVTLHRVYDKQVNPLNYFNNCWENEEQGMLFVNDDLNFFYGNSIQGTMNEERIWISFLNQSFSIWSKDDLHMKLAGAFYVDGLNIVLEPFEWFTEYPSTITLVFKN
jgi:hypothetical protein